MISERLSEFISNPECISGKDIPYLEEIVSKYPYFQTAHILLLVSLKKGDCERFNQQLRDSAIHIPDRHKLFNILFGEPSITDNVSVPKQQTLTIDEIVDFQFENNSKTELIIDKQVDIAESQKQEIGQELLEIDENNAGTDETFSSIIPENINETKDKIIESAENNSLLLIEKFIEESPVFIPNKLILDEPREDISLPSVEEDNSIVTETLASVFEMQKLYEKAIGVYEKLILKFPEKSTYFATRINELKEKIK
jgi:hypothetical protein